MRDSHEGRSGCAYGIGPSCRRRMACVLSAFYFWVEDESERVKERVIEGMIGSKDRSGVAAREFRRSVSEMSNAVYLHAWQENLKISSLFI